MWIVKDQLWFSGLGSEVQPLPSENAGPEWKQPAGFRRICSEAADWSEEQSTLQTGDCEVSRGLESVHVCFISIVTHTVHIKAKIQCDRLQDWRERQRTVSQSDQPEACCEHVWEVMLCSCLQGITLDYSIITCTEIEVLIHQIWS